MGYYSITFSDSSFINFVCAHTVFERSTDKEWWNPSGTSSDSRSDPLEVSCLGVGNSKTRITHCQQLTIIYCSMFRLHTVARERVWERESVRVYEQTQRDTPLPTPFQTPSQPRQQNSFNVNWQLINWLIDHFFEFH